MHFISFDKVKWYHWFYLIPWIIFALIYSFIMTRIEKTGSLHNPNAKKFLNRIITENNKDDDRK